MVCYRPFWTLFPTHAGREWWLSQVQELGNQLSWWCSRFNGHWQRSCRVFFLWLALRYAERVGVFVCWWCDLGTWAYNRPSYGGPSLFIDVATHLEKIATRVTRSQIEKAVESLTHPPRSNHHASRRPMNTVNNRGSGPYQRSSPNSNTTPSSSTPLSSTPGSYSSSTPSDYTPPNYTPNCISSPYISSPLAYTPSSSAYGSSPVYEEVYDTPPNTTTNSSFSINISHSSDNKTSRPIRREEVSRKRVAESLPMGSQSQKRYKW